MQRALAARLRRALTPALAGVSRLNEVVPKITDFGLAKQLDTDSDLSRTHRQQAFLSSVTHALRAKGVLGDIGSMQSLFGVVKNDIFAG